MSYFFLILQISSTELCIPTETILKQLFFCPLFNFCFAAEWKDSLKQPCGQELDESERAMKVFFNYIPLRSYFQKCNHMEL